MQSFNLCGATVSGKLVLMYTVADIRAMQCVGSIHVGSKLTLLFISNITPRIMVGMWWLKPVLKM